MPKLANSLKARRVKLEAPPASGIAAVASEYDHAVAMKRTPVMTKTRRRQPEGGHGDDAQGVVDGGADVAVRGAEEGSHPQHLVQRMSFSAFAACHVVS